MAQMTPYLCKTCEARFDLPGEPREGITCPICKGETVPALEKPASGIGAVVPRLDGALVHRCPCGETKKELLPGNILSCISCDIVLEIQANLFYQAKRKE